MKYRNVVIGKFIDRPNRFIAHVEYEGKSVTVHVKNTGRCKELLLPNVEVALAKTPVKTLIKVDLPAPFSPMSACISPSHKVNSTFCKALTPGKTLSIFLNSSIAFSLTVKYTS